MVEVCSTRSASLRSLGLTKGFRVSPASESSSVDDEAEGAEEGRFVRFWGSVFMDLGD